jgi:hypothetical protein
MLNEIFGGDYEPYEEKNHDHEILEV